MLDAVAIRAVTNSTGSTPIESGYDDVFKDIVVLSTPKRTEQRKEQESIFIPSQIENPSYEALTQMSAGNIPDSKITLAWAVKDIAAMDLIVPETGECLVRVNDRVVSISDNCKNVLLKVRTPPGLFVTEIRRTWGMASMGDLFLVTLDDREQSIRQ